MNPACPISWPKIIAHRGASGQAPENTLAAIRRAGELGARAVEFDVTVSLDGEAVIIHDLDVDRCSDGRGAVVSKTLAELQALDAGSWFAPAFAGERIPTLRQAVDEVLAHTMALNLEIKPTPGWEEKTVDATVATLSVFQPDDMNLLVSSMSTIALDLFHQRLPDVSLGLICDDVPENYIEFLDRHGCTSLHCHHAGITAGFVAALHNVGKCVRAFTVNNEAAAQRLFAMGVDGIFTDHPEQMAPLEASGA